MGRDILNELVELVRNIDWFSRIGILDSLGSGFIEIKGVCEAFIEGCPSLSDDQIKRIIWLPTANDQEDPFYKKKSFPPELSEGRMILNKEIMIALRTKNIKAFEAGPHDFSQAAKVAASYAFRAYYGEKTLELGDRWKSVVASYSLGKWPIGILDNLVIVI